jgi:hypothetical protein
VHHQAAGVHPALGHAVADLGAGQLHDDVGGRAGERPEVDGVPDVDLAAVPSRGALLDGDPGVGLAELRSWRGMVLVRRHGVLPVPGLQRGTGRGRPARLYVNGYSSVMGMPWRAPLHDCHAYWAICRLRR